MLYRQDLEGYNLEMTKLLPKVTTLDFVSFLMVRYSRMLKIQLVMVVSGCTKRSITKASSPRREFLRLYEPLAQPTNIAPRPEAVKCFLLLLAVLISF